MLARCVPFRLLMAVLFCGVATSAARADDAARAAAVSKGIDYLRKAQAPDGSFSAQSGPAVTAIVATALMKSGVSPADPLVANSLKYVQGFVHSDGGIYAEGGNHQNYETCIAIQAFVLANDSGSYKDLIDKAEGYVRGVQWDENEGQDPSSFSYGGAGYGSKKRPDLSNTMFLLDTLESVGAGPDDESVKKALTFVSRCQNLETEHNTTPFAAKVNDGGFYYTCAAGGSSPAGEADGGGLRSYASMTYAGLKSMIFAGVGPDDPRVKAAVGWAQKNYDLESNPGMGASGLYYYYHTFSKALAALGQESITDSSGNQHDWRADLISALASRQQEDGSWANKEPRWMEGDPNLVTSYALLSLSYCKPQSK